MFFNSVKEINRLRKQINGLLSKGMLNIYWSYYWEKLTFSKLQFSKFKKLVTRSVFEELQLTQISLNFKTSCCNLKIRGLGAKLCVAFLLFLFWKELWRFKSNSPCFLLKKSIRFIKSKTEAKIENLTHSFGEMNFVFIIVD